MLLIPNNPLLLTYSQIDLKHIVFVLILERIVSGPQLQVLSRIYTSLLYMAKNNLYSTASVNRLVCRYSLYGFGRFVSH